MSISISFTLVNELSCLQISSRSEMLRNPRIWESEINPDWRSRGYSDNLKLWQSGILWKLWTFRNFEIILIGFSGGVMKLSYNMWWNYHTTWKMTRMCRVFRGCAPARGRHRSTLWGPGTRLVFGTFSYLMHSFHQNRWWERFSENCDLILTENPLLSGSPFSTRNNPHIHTPHGEQAQRNRAMLLPSVSAPSTENNNMFLKLSQHVMKWHVMKWHDGADERCWPNHRRDDRSLPWMREPEFYRFSEQFVFYKLLFVSINVLRAFSSLFPRLIFLTMDNWVGMQLQPTRLGRKHWKTIVQHRFSPQSLSFGLEIQLDYLRKTNVLRERQESSAIMGSRGGMPEAICIEKKQ